MIGLKITVEFWDIYETVCMGLMAIKKYFLFNSLALKSILNSKKLLGPFEAFCVGFMAIKQHFLFNYLGFKVNIEFWETYEADCMDLMVIKQYFLFNFLALKSILNSGKHMRLFVWT